MKLFNIDYIAAEGTPVAIDAIKGYTSEEQAGAAPLKDGSVRLQARAATDLASLGAPVLEALAAFKARKGETIEATPDALWAILNPPKKDRQAGLTAPKTDGTSSSSPDDKAGSTEGQKPGKKDKMKKPAKTKKAAKKKAAKAKNGTSTPRGEKTLKVKALLERKSGCTSAEVKKATGWPAVSMPAMAKACGLKLRKVKEAGKPTQYFGE